MDTALFAKLMFDGHSRTVVYLCFSYTYFQRLYWNELGFIIVVLATPFRTTKSGELLTTFLSTPMVR